MGGSAGWRIGVEFGLGDSRLDQIVDLQPSVCLPHSMANQIGFAGVLVVRTRCSCPSPVSNGVFVPVAIRRGRFCCPSGLRRVSASWCPIGKSYGRSPSGCAIFFPVRSGSLGRAGSRNVRDDRGSISSDRARTRRHSTRRDCRHSDVW